MSTLHARTYPQQLTKILAKINPVLVSDTTAARIQSHEPSRKTRRSRHSPCARIKRPDDIGLAIVEPGAKNNSTRRDSSGGLYRNVVRRSFQGSDEHSRLLGMSVNVAQTELGVIAVDGVEGGENDRSGSCRSQGEDRKTLGNGGLDR